MQQEEMEPGQLETPVKGFQPPDASTPDDKELLDWQSDGKSQEEAQVPHAIDEAVEEEELAVSKVLPPSQVSSDPLTIFDPTECPVKKRSLSNGDSFTKEQPLKLANTASDSALSPDETAQGKTNSLGSKSATEDSSVEYKESPSKDVVQQEGNHNVPKDSHIKTEFSEESMAVKTRSRTQTLKIREDHFERKFLPEEVDKINAKVQKKVQIDFSSNIKRSSDNSSDLAMEMNQPEFSQSRSQEPPRSTLTLKKDFQVMEDKPEFDFETIDTTMAENIQAEFFSARYKMQTGGQQKSQGTGYFNSILKFFYTDKVEIKNPAALPVSLLHRDFYVDQAKLETIIKERQSSKSEKKQLEQFFVTKEAQAFNSMFASLIWLCYRKGFKPLLMNETDREGMPHVFKMRQSMLNRPLDRNVKIGSSNDVGWGCTIRVAQMIFCHTMLRHRLNNYSMETLPASQEYQKVLTLVNDNYDGKQGAFSIQNVARMSAIFDKFPCEWHGPGSISTVFKELNKVYQPFEDLKVCLFTDGCVYFNKIKKMACQKPRNYLHSIQNKTPDQMSQEKWFQINAVKTLFKPFVLAKENDLHEETKESDRDQSFKFARRDVEEKIKETPINQYLRQDWINGVLVLISTRLALKSIAKEQFAAILHYFWNGLNVGIIGGRPKEAYYLVGVQRDFLIFLDPHNSLDAVPADPLLIKKLHLQCHERVAKKIHYSKLDPTMTFGFYLKDSNDYNKFEKYMDLGRQNFGDDWLFTSMEERPKFARPIISNINVTNTNLEVDDGFDLVTEEKDARNSDDDYDFI